MLKSVLRYIRQKPKVIRNQYALALASVFTAGVVFIWLASGGFGLDGTGSSQQASEGNTPFSNLIKQAKDQFASSKEALTKAEQVASTTKIVTASSTAGEMILSAETLKGVDQTSWITSTTASTTVSTSFSNFGFSSVIEATSTPAIKYIEVRIATTTRATETATTSPQ